MLSPSLILWYKIFTKQPILCKYAIWTEIIAEIQQIDDIYLLENKWERSVYLLLVVVFRLLRYALQLWSKKLFIIEYRW